MLKEVDSNKQQIPSINSNNKNPTTIPPLRCTSNVNILNKKAKMSTLLNHQKSSELKNNNSISRNVIQPKRENDSHHSHHSIK